MTDRATDLQSAAATPAAVSPACTPSLRTSLRGRLRRGAGKALLRNGGWTLQGDLPSEPKFILVCAPHTSNWDFVVMLEIAFALDFEVHWVGKDSLFRPPFGKLARWGGGIPVVRGAGQNQSGQVAEAIRKADRMIVAIAPEGTRSKAGRWRTGFYHMAVQANVPIQLGFLDYTKKVGGFGPCIYPSGDLEADFAKIAAFYRDIQGKFPEQQGEITHT
ncbi:MAG: lysophospholipid acyltransferase family protein [Deltaproteobacteria bacterium]|nr:lysophospholipid acyltransferase family protein [Deltaproteobacteria bacterium]